MSRLVITTGTRAGGFGEFPVGIRWYAQLSGRRREVLREQRRHLAGGLLGQPVRGAVEFGEAIGPGDLAPAQLGRGPRDEPVAVTPGEHRRPPDRPGRL